MSELELENYIYKSYLKASKYQNFKEKDSKKRNPIFTKQILSEKSITPCVVITGSKGKGSIANMISQILQIKYDVGLMTSPHIESFCERFRINNDIMTKEELEKYINLIKKDIDRIDNKIKKNEYISPIGIQAMIALEYFNEGKTQFNVFECGKGAQFDDANNIRHQYAIINDIFLEHTRELGSSIAEIAKDKSHVISGEQKCVYVSKQSSKVYKIIEERANLYKVPIKKYGVDFYEKNVRYKNDLMIFDVVTTKKIYTDIAIPLLGSHQARNCSLAISLCEDVLGDKFDINKIKTNLKKLNWQGRMEFISKKPLVLLDACINSKSCDAIEEVCRQYQIKKPMVIIGIPNDKDYLGVAKRMSLISDKLILTKSQNQHYIFDNSQITILRKNNILAKWEDDIIAFLKNNTEYENSIIILGTTSLITDIKKSNIFK